jgi:hypothetical protein
MILVESKRDDLLLPYLEIVKSKGINMSLGQFKGLMLMKLSDEGGIRNLSLSSNYYLAGAVKYYFQGFLTQNDDLSILSDSNKRDVWNEDVCKRLNACIEVLRNAYIDTVGTKFEQPEDFGTLSLPKLLRKYNKKIMQVLSNPDGEEEQEQEKPQYITNGPIGTNGYSFEIIYSYDQCTKYERPTAPGSWCITYGLGHYNAYIRRLNIHYVIFTKDGYKNVKREMGPNFNPMKPHDEYGNSMIALLQSNSNGEPVYITSRWNHGSGDTPRIEADYAYNKQEFLNVVGITDEDLKRIFVTWQHTAPEDQQNVRNNASRPKAIDRSKKGNILRALKYIQMRINGGEKPENLVQIEEAFQDDVPLSRNTAFCYFEYDGENYYFLMDKGKIFFDTLINRESGVSSEKSWTIFCQDFNLIFLQYVNYGFIYDVRFHKFVDIGGVTKFKRLPETNRVINKDTILFEVKLDSKTIALVSPATRKPLVLPNHEFWFNAVFTCYNYYASQRDLYCSTYSRDCAFLEIVYDESSCEKYFYDTKRNNFFEAPKNPGLASQYVHDTDKLNIPVLGEIADENFISIGYISQGCGRARWARTSQMLFDAETHERVKLGDYELFNSIESVSQNVPNVYKFSPGTAEGKSVFNDSSRVCIYDSNTKKIYSDIHFMTRIDFYDDWQCLCIEVDDSEDNYIDYIHGFHCMIYDNVRGGFVKNTIAPDYPDRTSFILARGGRFRSICKYPVAYLNSDVRDSDYSTWMFSDDEINRMLGKAIREKKCAIVDYKSLPLLEI